MKAKGMDARIIVEGAATGLLPQMAEAHHPQHKLWEQAKSEGIVDGVCKGCAHKMGTIDEATRQGLMLLDDMSGHPAMSRYIEAGFDVCGGAVTAAFRHRKQEHQNGLPPT
jgi:hypothetical protein